MAEPTAHIDTFIRDNLPPKDLWPEMDYSVLPELAAYPARMNAAAELLDHTVASGGGNRPAVHFGKTTWSYADLLATANRIARVLVSPGKRVRSGDALISLYDTDAMVVRAQVPSRYLPAVRAYLGARWRGSRHSPEIEDATQEVFLKMIVVKGVMAIQSGDNPRTVEQKLKTFLQPSQRQAPAGEG